MCLKVKRMEVFRRNTLLLKVLFPWMQLMDRARCVLLSKSIYVLVCVHVPVYCTIKYICVRICVNICARVCVWMCVRVCVCV